MEKESEIKTKQTIVVLEEIKRLLDNRFEVITEFIKKEGHHLSKEKFEFYNGKAEGILKGINEVEIAKKLILKGDWKL